jgi:hypothetical protein
MANEAMRDNWTTGAEGWVRNERIFDAGLCNAVSKCPGCGDTCCLRSRQLDGLIACLLVSDVSQLQPLVEPQLGQAWQEPARIICTPHCIHIGASL